jgi:hypothetical protein
MANNDWDLYSILPSNKVTTFTNPMTIFGASSPSQTSTTITSTTSIVPAQNTTTSYFNDFNLTHENSTVSLFSPMPDDFVDLELLKIRFNHNSTISTPITTMHNPTINPLTTPTTIIPTIITPAHSTLIPTPSCPTTINTNTNFLTHITSTSAITNTSVQYPNKNYTFFDYPITIDQEEMQSNEFIELEEMLSKYNSTTATTTTFPTTTTNAFTIPTLTTTIPNQTTTITTSIPPITTMTDTITSFRGTNQNAIFSDFPILINQQQIQQNHKNQVFVPYSCTKITTTPFDGTYNHPLVLQQPIEHPQQPKPKSRKRYNINFCDLIYFNY